jgi:hypothetical protein
LKKDVSKEEKVWNVRNSGKNKEHRINKSRENIVSFDTIRLLFSVSA